MQPTGAQKWIRPQRGRTSPTSSRPPDSGAITKQAVPPIQNLCRRRREETLTKLLRPLNPSNPLPQKHPEPPGLGPPNHRSTVCKKWLVIRQGGRKTGNSRRRWSAGNPMEHFRMHLPPYLFLTLSVITVAIVIWFSLDMRSIIKWLQRKNQLEIKGQWKDLEQHFQRASKTCRPFVWLHRQYLLPGTVTTYYALLLHKQGRHEEALSKANQAIQQIERKPRIFQPIYHSQTRNILGGALRAHTLILTELGRYDEGREAAARLRQLNLSDRPNVALALLEYRCGHLDEALAQAQTVSPEKPQQDTVRSITALSYFMKGELDQALQVLLYEPNGTSKYCLPAWPETIIESDEGAKLAELQRRKRAGFFPPARLQLLAKVYLAREEFENADRVLDQAEKMLGPEPGLQASYCQHRACSLAAQGKAAEAENCLERMRAIVRELPKRSLLLETHYAAVRSYLYLGKSRDALAELTAAQPFVLHPIEKHAINYWIARAHEASGDQEKAIPYYQIVAADNIPSWMRKEAIEALNRDKAEQFE